MPPINGKSRVFFPLFWNPSFLHKAAKQIVAMTQNYNGQTKDGSLCMKKDIFLKLWWLPDIFYV